MPYLGVPNIPGNLLEGVVHHTAKRAVEEIQSHYQDRSNTERAFKLAKFDKKRHRDEYEDPFQGRQEYKRARPTRTFKSRMPLTRRRRRFNPKRRRSTIPRRYRRRARVSRPIRGIRYGQMVEFKCYAPIQLSGAAGALDTLVLKCNSLSDPIGADGQRLPAYLDQWAGFYEKYMVYGTRYKFRGHHVSGTGAGVFGMHLTTDAGAETSEIEYLEQKNRVYHVSSNDIDTFNLSITYKPKKFWKIKDMKDAINQKGAFSTTPGDPTDLMYCHIFSRDLNQTDACNYEGLLEMTFLVYLFDPIQVPGSTLA